MFIPPPGVFWEIKGFKMVSEVNPEKLMNFDFRSDDILIATYPKTGTTWLSEIIWLLCNSMDYQKASEINLWERVSFLEYEDGYNRAKSQDGIRVMKTHLPLSLLFEQDSKIKPKIISITRDLKDTLISFYHFIDAQTFKDFTGDLEEFIGDILSDQCFGVPLDKFFLDFINFTKMHSETCLMVEYEKLHENFESEVNRLCQFLGKNLLENEEMLKLKSHTSFQKMKENPATNQNILRAMGILDPSKSDFMRKGKIGDWKNHLSKELSEKIDDYIEKKMPSLMKTNDVNQD